MKKPVPNRRVTGAWGLEVRSHAAVWLLAMTAALAGFAALSGAPVVLRPTLLAVMAASQIVLGFVLRFAGSRNAGFAFCGAWVLGVSAAVLLIAGGLDGYALQPAAAYLACAAAAGLVTAASVQERLFWRRIRRALEGTEA